VIPDFSSLQLTSDACDSLVSNQSSCVSISPNRPLARPDHFAGAGKMIIKIDSRLIARHHGPADGFLKTPPLTVSEQRLKFTGAPEFCSIGSRLIDA
jgi:hypothetical protein